MAPTPDADEEDHAQEANPDETKDKQGVNTAILMDDSGRNIGVARKKKKFAYRKPWTIGGVLESHRLVNQSDLQGNGRNKFINYLYLFGGYGITPFDRVQIRSGIYQRFTADAGESGMRMDDFEPMYTRVFPLPLKVTWRQTTGVILPLSYESQRATMRFAPRTTTQFDRRFGNLNMTLRGGVAYYNFKNKSGPGGNANPYLSLSTSLVAEYSMPFHESWSVGGIGVVGTSYRHDPTNGNDPNAARFGVVNDQTFGDSQPAQGRYGMEVFTRYILPTVKDVKSDFTIGYSNGDYAIGYLRANRDGINRFYGFFRTNAAVYAELGVRY